MKVFVNVVSVYEVKISRLFRPEQKKFSWMQDLVEKISKPGELVADKLPGTFALQGRAWKFHGIVISLAAKVIPNDS